MKKYYIFIIAMLSLFIYSCSNFASPEDSVTTYLTTIQKANERQEPCDRQKIAAMYCNKREPIISDSYLVDDAMDNTYYSHNVGTFEIVATGMSKEGNAALVKVCLTRPAPYNDSSERTKDIFLSKVGNKWLIDFFTKDNSEYYEANKDLYAVIKAKEAEALANTKEENFDEFITKFTEDYEFQITRIKFPVGYSTYISFDGSEEKTQINKNKWNEQRFSKWQIMNQSPVKDDKGNMTYSWESDGGAACGSATFSLINKNWHMTNYSTFSI